MRPLSYEPVPGLPGYRRLPGSSGVISGLGAAFVGLEVRDPDLEAAVEAIRSDPGTALGGARRSVHIFTDAQCPNCRVLEAWLLPYLDTIAGLTTRLHHYPVLGPASERAARLAVAGQLLGNEDVGRIVLREGVRPGPHALRQVADRAGLCPETLAVTVRRPEIDTTLRNTRALARVLGLPGTPSLLIGRTVAVGRLPRATVTRVLRDEALL